MANKNQSAIGKEKYTFLLDVSASAGHQVRFQTDGGGVWHATVKLRPGGHQYLFLVDSWPGSLHELQLAIKRAVIMARGDESFGSDPAPELSGQNDGPAANRESPVQIGSFVSLEKLEEAHLHKILERTSSLTAAAAILGIDQATLYRKRKKIGLVEHRERKRPDVSTPPDDANPR